MRATCLVVVATVVAGGTRAHADPKLEASAFVGFDTYSDNTQLGNSWAPEQVPRTAPVFGVRVLGLVLPRFVALGAHASLALAVEGELGMATSFTGGSYDVGRMSYFAPVFDWRAHLLVRVNGIDGVRPHLVVGAGGETIASTSPFMQKETDPEVYWGLGATIPVLDHWMLRADARHGLMPGRDGGVSSTISIQIGAGTTFGVARTRARTQPHGDPLVDQPRPTPDERDSDGDGIPDWLDVCPNEPETVNGIDDDDGCPEQDPDGDGILGDADKCPDQAEDFDHFQDEDGCPDPDNDGDGLVDARDACPNEPETVNGFEDEDGCPDVVPPAVVKALATAETIKFDGGSARMADAQKRALAPLLKAMQERDNLRLAIVVQLEGARGAEDLAKRRADAIKWYLADQGLVATRVDTSIALATAKGPRVAFSLVSSAP